MANLFSNAGRVSVVYDDDNSIPLGLLVGDFKNSLGLKGIVSTMSVSGQGGFQVMHTLRRAIYMYTFGERVGEMSIGGILVNADCTDNRAAIENGTTQSGIYKFFSWYERNRLTTTGQPISITVVPGLVLSGFLVNMKFQIEDAAVPLAQFSINFLYPPRIVQVGNIAPINAAATPTINIVSTVGG
jgi:hypothetical protein